LIKYHAYAVDDKIIKDHLVNGIKVGEITDVPKLDFPGLLIYVNSYRFTISEDIIFLWVQVFNFLKNNKRMLLYTNK
jgi:hypothetical protein